MITGVKRYLRRGITLIEITVAIFILGATAIPMIGLFTGYYDTSTRQLEQDVALKMAESTLSLLMNRKYSDLAEGRLTTVSLDINTSAGTFPINLIFNGKTSEQAQIKIGRVTYTIEAAITEAFEGQDIHNPHSRAAVFTYMDLRTFPSNHVEKYSSFDDLIGIIVKVGYGGDRPIILCTFRADMVR